MAYIYIYISMGKTLTVEALANKLKDMKLLDKPIEITFGNREHSLMIKWKEIEDKSYIKEQKSSQLPRHLMFSIP